MSRSRSNAALRAPEAASVFAALGDETRLTLVRRLATEGPLSIARLSEGSKMSRQAITKHLDALASAGLVRDLHDGRARIFELEPLRLERARKSLELISAQWDDALERLAAFVARAP